MPFGNGENGPPKGFRHVRAINEADGQHAGHKWIDIHRGFAAHGLQQVVQPDGASIKNQQHQHQFGHTPDQGGVQRRHGHQRRATRQLGGGPRQTQYHRHAQGEQRDANGQRRALENGEVVVTHRLARTSYLPYTSNLKYLSLIFL